MQYRGDYKNRIGKVRLKPCPFCGRDDMLSGLHPGQMYVICNNCGTYGPSSLSKAGTQFCIQEADAISKWNTRYDEEGNYSGE